MPASLNPFPLIEVEADLDALRQHWLSLVRDSNDMPLWKDFSTSPVAHLSGRLLILDVLDKPSLYRFSGIVGGELEKRCGADVRDMLVYEAPHGAPFDFLQSQADATFESAAPTYYRGGEYSRILLPMRSEDRIVALLGAVTWR